MRVRSLFTLVVALASFACQPADPASGGECSTGKCDGISNTYLDNFSDMSRVDLGDLANIGARFAADEISHQLSKIPYLDIRLAQTEIYTTSDKAGPRNDLTLHDLQKLHAGLAARYGDRAFNTRINKLRADHLAANPETVWAESSFKLGARFAPSFSFAAGGFTGAIGLYGTGHIAATVIAPYQGEYKPLYEAPIAAITKLRGFIIPEKIDHVRAMVPGESITKSSDGVIGFNVGVGIPLNLITVADALVVQMVFSAAARMALVGKQVDMQLIRDDNDTAIVDVGVTNPTGTQHWEIGAKTKWGIEAFKDLQVGPVRLKSVADNALRELVTKRLFSANASYDREKLRHTIMRFAFDLKRADDKEVGQALIQAWHGDVRLAQSLALRPNSGVKLHLDFTRKVKSVSTHLGVQFLGMKFYREAQQLDGQVVINTGEKSQRLLFDELSKNRNVFFTKRGYTRQGVVAELSESGVALDADQNFRVQLRESDSFTERDQILDHVDPLLGLFITPKALNEQIAPISDAIQVYVDRKCVRPVPNAHTADEDERKYSACLASLPGDKTIAAKQNEARAKFNQLLAAGSLRGGFDTLFDRADVFARQLLELKIAVQSTYRYPAMLVGPKSKMIVDYRLSDAALTSMLTTEAGRARFEQALRDVVAMMAVNHGDVEKDKLADIKKRMGKLEGEIQAVMARLAGHGNDFGRWVGLSKITRSVGGAAQNIGGHGQLVLVNAAGELVEMTTAAERKNQRVVALFDELVSKADLNVRAHQAIGYALLLASDPSLLELLISFDFKKDTYADYQDMRLYGRGMQAKLIEAGDFDLQALIHGKGMVSVK